MYIVRDENTLGYTIGSTESKNLSIVVMAVDYMSGGDPTLIDHETLAAEGTWREATKEDEERFKVHLGL